MTKKIYKIKEFRPYPVGPYTSYMSACDCGKITGDCNCPVKGGKNSAASAVHENVVKK